jgi:peptidoglycan/LPS O-acetylase OafA/YrhL
MYLLHLWAFHAARLVNDAIGWTGAYSLLVSGTAATIVVAECSYRLYEKPFLKLKKYFQRS